MSGNLKATKELIIIGCNNDRSRCLLETFLNTLDRLKKFRVGFLLAIFSYLAYFAINASLGLLAHVSRLIPAADFREYSDSHGEDIYFNMISPDVDITNFDISFNQIIPSNEIRDVDPYAELFRISNNYSSLMKALAVTLLLISVVLLYKRSKVLCKLTSEVCFFIFFNLFCAQLFFMLIAGNSIGQTDEAFVFASEARNFAAGGLPAVPISGSFSNGDSSVDLGIVLMAGAILWLAPFLQAETALIFGYAILLFAINLSISILLLKIYKLPILLISAICFTGFFLPATYLSTTNGMPTGVAISTFVLFILVSWDVVIHKRTKYFVAGSLFAGIMRWEFGLLAAVLSIGFLLNLRQFKDEDRSRITFTLALPVGFFITSSILRKILYGSYIPAGARSKSVGLDGAYLEGGFVYLRDASESMMWPLLLSASLFVAIPIAWSLNKKMSTLVFVVTLLPLMTGVFTGGDWFNTLWARYVMPPLIALYVLAIAIAWRSSDKLLVKRQKVGVLLLAFVFSQYGLLSTMYRTMDNPHTDASFARSNCLARAGLLLQEVVPFGESIATAEVNTLAYFANRPLTDLIGLVDPRVSSVHATPRIEGDVLHRRANPSIIYEDRPAAIYLYEGAICAASQDLSDELNKAEWNRILNGDYASYSRFRAGNLDELLEVYSPKSYYVEGEVVLRILVRNDLL